MSKPEFVFYWADTPKEVCGEGRTDVARLFRVYRRRDSGFRLRKDGPGRYMVTLSSPGVSTWPYIVWWANSADAVGIFERSKFNG